MAWLGSSSGHGHRGSDVPGPENAGQVLFWGYVTFFASLVLLLGRRVATALEYAEWFMTIWIILALLFLGIFFTSGLTWLTVITGFFAGGRYQMLLPQRHLR